MELSLGSSIESPGEELVSHGGRGTEGEEEFYDSFMGGSTWPADFGRYLRRGVRSAGLPVANHGREV